MTLLASSAIFADDLPEAADSKYVECLVQVKGAEFPELSTLDTKKIELKFQFGLGWVGTGELQIDPKKKHEFKLRKTMAPGIDLITKLRNGIELGFFGLVEVKLEFEQAGYATTIVCKDFEGEIIPPEFQISVGE